MEVGEAPDWVPVVAENRDRLELPAVGGRWWSGAGLYGRKDQQDSPSMDEDSQTMK